VCNEDLWTLVLVKRELAIQRMVSTGRNVEHNLIGSTVFGSHWTPVLMFLPLYIAIRDSNNMKAY